ncbi:protein of unknown function DUF1822 [[Leptolyngbya] sp. PCC 7376]|uniref:DUF1822 family protein n=1 Tax=[Leptolyngbya] sp. PCC 7376 TaxID=111781 RepID=UPI00029F3B09|nr:DUF1822 family protein [[Leptolyngbya] sp. PCC 7376]AFY36822.1 protein of unknown function DUF1822 [[Leptolyngbya] sp. PCC 7376]
MVNPETKTTINIPQAWLVIAEKFAAEQIQLEAQTQIFQQTLAVYGLQKYLQLGDISTALEESYSWHPQTRILTGWADLLLPEHGRILCCFADQSGQVTLPPILPLNTLGFIVADLAADNVALDLVGFLPQRQIAPEAKQFSTQNLQAIATVFDELYLLSEEQYLIKTEIEKIATKDKELNLYFNTFLMPDNLLDIVNQLNQTVEKSTVEIQNLFSLAKSSFSGSEYAVAEANSIEYIDNLNRDKITQASTKLTQTLLAKTRELHQELKAI